MTNQIYTATGCARCKITKSFLRENGIDYEEFDFKAEGKDAFAQFYRENRKNIFRDKDGVEFPVFYDGKQIRQGVSVIIGYLKAGDGLVNFIDRSVLHGEWIDGFKISGQNREHGENFLAVLKYLKDAGLKIEAQSDGTNADLLEKALQQKLVDRLLMEVKGPIELYEAFMGYPVDKDTLHKSISLAARFPEFSFQTVIHPIKREDGDINFLTPEEIGETAQLIKEASGSNSHPYLLIPFDLTKTDNEEFKQIEPMPDSAFFKYRTQARRHMPKTEIKKTHA